MLNLAQSCEAEQAKEMMDQTLTERKGTLGRRNEESQWVRPESPSSNTLSRKTATPGFLGGCQGPSLNIHQINILRERPQDYRVKTTEQSISLSLPPSLPNLVLAYPIEVCIAF